MIQHAASQIGNSAAFGIISICLFFAVFIGTLVWAFTKKKAFLKTMSSLPLDDEKSGARQNGEDHHG